MFFFSKVSTGSVSACYTLKRLLRKSENKQKPLKCHFIFLPNVNALKYLYYVPRALPALMELGGVAKGQNHPSSWGDSELSSNKCCQCIYPGPKENLALILSALFTSRTYLLEDRKKSFPCNILSRGKSAQTFNEGSNPLKSTCFSMTFGLIRPL